MLILYWRPTCPFCHRVLDTAGELGLTFEKKDIADPVVAAELVKRGGRQQVPYLVDTERGVEMYESMDIDAYLRAQYAKS